MIKPTLAVALILISSPAMSQKFLHTCKVKNKGVDFIQTDFEIRYDNETSNVLVFDQLIDHFVGQPVAGKISEDGPKKRVFTWRVPVVARSGQNTIMAYRAALFVATNRILVTAKPHGYINNFTARGTCKVTSG